MFVRFVNGRPYLAETQRVGGRVIQRHLGPANDPLSMGIAKLMAAMRDEERQEERQRRDEEHQRRDAERERNEELDGLWRNTHAAVRAALEATGYHNPRGRGWRRRRSPTAAD